ncbi:MAG: nucleoside deaminase [Cyclobacteriaceae bacterium]
MELTIHSDEHYMKQALMEAQKAEEENEIPIGAVVVANNRIISRAYNQVEKLQDVTAHAEMLAITAAQNYLGAKYLDQCTLFVTLEPCVMCAGALYWSQIGRIVIGARDEKRGYNRLSPPVIHPKSSVEFGLMENEAGDLISSFFKKMRDRKSK